MLSTALTLVSLNFDFVSLCCVPFKWFCVRCRLTGEFNDWSRMIIFLFRESQWRINLFTRLSFRKSWHLLFQQLLLINLHFLVVACGIVMMLFAQCFHTFCDVRWSGKKASNCRILFLFLCTCSTVRNMNRH